MKLVGKSAAAFTLVLALAACGGGNEDAADTAAVTDTAAMAPAATDTAAVPAATDTAAAAATPTPTPSASASATPTPTPSPSVSPSAKATPVAMATKPAEFAQCSACHSTERGKNGIGPTLAGVVGRKAGGVPGYDYSDAMKSSGLTWNQANLDRFLADPKGVVPGTKMTYPGLKDAAKRQGLINYLKTL